MINEIRGKQKVKIKPSFIIDGTLVEERRIIVNVFNNYFTSIASKLNESENGLLIEPLPKYTDLDPLETLIGQSRSMEWYPDNFFQAHYPA